MHLMLLVLLLLSMCILATYTFASRESFSMFNNSVETVFKSHDIRTCKPLGNAMQGDVSSIPIARNMRLISSLTDPDNTCYIKADDTILDGKPCTSESGPNTNLYDLQFSGTVDSITSESVIDPYISPYGHSSVCSITFKSTAQPNDVVNYAKFVNSNDPAIRKLQSDLDTLNTKENSMSQQLNNTMADLTDTKTRLTLASAASSSLSSQLASLNAQNSSLSQALADKQRNIDALNGRLSQCGTTFNPQQSIIRSVGSTNKCLDIEGISRNDGAKAHVWEVWNGPNQKWTMDDRMRLVSLNSGKCLDLPGGQTGNGNWLQQYSCHDGANQKWIYDNKKRLRSYVNPYKCVDISEGRYADGQKIQIWDCHEGTNQKWTV